VLRHETIRDVPPQKHATPNGDVKQKP
jgi:hypothetical protein